MAILQQLQSILTTPRVIGSCLFTYVVYLFILAVYRLYLSPIAHFPGAKITIVSGWYETYLDVFKGGQFTFQIERWHEAFGPIIRINPTEIHISDPDFYDIAYSSSLPADKLESFRDRFGLPGAVQSTVAHATHHRRRMALNPYFSKKQINEFSPQIQQYAEKLRDRLLREYKGTSKIVSLNDAWAAYVTDIVIFYSFGRSYHFLDYPDFIAPFTNSLKELANSIHVALHFPWFLKVLQSLPESVVGLINPAMISVFQFQNEIKSQILQIVNGDNNEARQKSANKTVFSSLFASDLPPEELSVTRIQQEAAGLVGAGIETSKSTLALASFHILDNPEVLSRLRKELIDAIPNVRNPPPLSTIEKLPYLTAIIQEALRLSYGVAQRLPRTSPHAPLPYSPTYVIPANTPFSMSHYLMHHSEAAFPNSHAFNPDRWLQQQHQQHPAKNGRAGNDNGVRPQRHFVPFSKGTRNCVGQNLAWAQIYMGLAYVFRSVDLELYDTGKEAVEMTSEYFVPMPRVGSKGVRVAVL